MKNERLRNNEIMFFIDFNNTLVDYENEYDNYSAFYEDGYSGLGAQTSKSRLNRCLNDFENKTGLTPVICVVTNSRSDVVDGNGYQGIFNDFYMTFLNTSIPTDSDKYEWFKNHSINRFFKYLVYKDNDHFYKIDGLNPNKEQIFERVDFDSKAMDISLIPQFRKKESVERIMSFADPKKQSRFLFFAGDNIKDDYPMKEIETPYGTSKFFVRPGRSQKMTYHLMKEFAEAKGETFSMINLLNGKKIKNLDVNNFSFLSEDEQKRILDYASGDTILLTEKNNRGLVSGIYQVADIIARDGKVKNNQFGE